MKGRFFKVLAAASACLMLMQGALAESISFNGTVGVSDTAEVYAPIGGTVESVEVEVGQRVNAGDAIATLATTKVYATESGTVTGVFGQPGDSAETVATKYGAVMYIEGASVYTIAASTENAYNATENKFVHVGETVYLSCYSDGDHTGTGVITSITGTDYTVEVTSGDFLVGETVSVYREDSYKAATRIGRGTLNRTSPTAVTGTGSIVSFAVEDGDTVERGDLLFETLNGSFDGLYMSGNQILATADGVVAELNVEEGTAIEKDALAAVLYPDDAMRIEAEIAEYNLADIAEGDAVSIELLWNQDDEVTYDGTISRISRVASASSDAAAAAAADAATGESEDVTYTVYIDFTPDENTRFGMSAIVSTLDSSEMEDVETEAVDSQEAASDVTE